MDQWMNEILFFTSISLQVSSIYLIQEDYAELLLPFSNKSSPTSDFYEQRARGKQQNLLVISIYTHSNPEPFREVTIEKYL